MMTPAFRSRQQGVALVTAILMVAIATALATKMAWDNQLNMRRTEANLNLEQARELALGAETVAISILQEQGDDFGNFLQDIEAPIAYEAGVDDIDLGAIQGQLFDLQGRMNVNNLVIGGEVKEPVKEQFRRLFDSLRQDVDISPALIDTIIDWIDPDTIPYGAGAEDDSYTALDPPYRTSNNYFLDISELRSVGGMTPEIYAALLPHVVALPPGWCGSTDEVTPVNLNFSTPQVIAAVTEVAPGVAEDMVARRADSAAAWESAQDIGLPDDLNTAAEPYISYNTNCYALSVIVNVGSSTLTMYSLVDRASIAGGIVSRVRAYGLEN